MQVRVLCLLLLSCLFACQFGGGKLQEWSEAKNGEARLSAFFADVQRDRKLRSDALDYLVRGGHFSSIMGVLEGMEDLEQKFWVKQCWYKVSDRLEKQRFSEVERIEAASLAYYLLEYRQHLDGLAHHGQPHQKLFSEFAVVNLVTWALETLKNDGESPKGSKKLSEVLFAAAVASPKDALPQFDGFLSTMPEETDYILVTDILARLKSPEASQLEAKALLALAKKNYPKLTKDLGERMFKNRNETLLRFLLDSALDIRVLPTIRLKGLEAARILKTKATQGLLALLRVEEPAKDNFMRAEALKRLWLYCGGKEILATALNALPTEGTYWPTGTAFRDQVRLFCDAALSESAGDVKDTLVGLTSSSNRYAQIYAAECILRFYPSEAPDLLQDLIDEELEVDGWNDDGSTSFTEYLEASFSQ